jgi:hypothetical protein
MRTPSGVRAASMEDRDRLVPWPSFLAACYVLLVIKDHTLAAPIWLTARSAPSEVEFFLSSLNGAPGGTLLPVGLSLSTVGAVVPHGGIPT